MGVQVLQAREKFRYCPALDGLRALAVTAVMFAHMGVPHLSGGRIGVYLFFVLSGFLITRLLLDEASEGKIRIAAFYARRAVRLMPAMWILVLFTVVYVTVNPNPRFYLEQPLSSTLNGALPSLLYYANWTWYFHGPESTGILGHLWSLSVEEQFYLAWPIMLGWSLARSRPSPVILLCIASLAALIVRLVVYSGPDDNQFMFGTHMVADQLLIGSGLAFLVLTSRVAVERWARLLFLPSVGLLLVIALGGDDWATESAPRFVYPLELTTVALASAVVIARLVLYRDWLSSLLSRPPLVLVGRMSYGMYLWHLLVIAVFRDHTDLKGIGLFAAVYGATLAVAAVSFILVEKPLIMLFKSRSHQRSAVSVR